MWSTWFVWSTIAVIFWTAVDLALYRRAPQPTARSHSSAALGAVIAAASWIIVEVDLQHRLTGLIVVQGLLFGLVNLGTALLLARWHAARERGAPRAPGSETERTGVER